MSWISKAIGLIEGLEISEDACPLHATECVFGKWYYGEGQILREFQEYQQIEKPHMNLHQSYMQIFKIITGLKDSENRNTDTRNFFQKLIGKKAPKISNKSGIDEARTIFRVLQKQSDIVIACLHKLETKVSSLDDEFFLTKQVVV